MFRILFVLIISLHLFSNSFSQSISDTSKVLLRFNEPMSREGIFETSNYKILQNGITELNIFKVGIVAGDSAVVLFVNKVLKDSNYKVIVSNLKDKSGNPISSEHNSFSFHH